MSRASRSTVSSPAAKRRGSADDEHAAQPAGRLQGGAVSTWLGSPSSAPEPSRPTARARRRAGPGRAAIVDVDRLRRRRGRSSCPPSTATSATRASAPFDDGAHGGDRGDADSVDVGRSHERRRAVAQRTFPCDRDARALAEDVHPRQGEHEQHHRRAEHARGSAPRAGRASARQARPERAGMLPRGPAARSNGCLRLGLGSGSSVARTDGCERRTPQQR